MSINHPLTKTVARGIEGDSVLSDASTYLFGCDDPETYGFTDMMGFQRSAVRPCRKCKPCGTRKKKQWAGRLIAESHAHAQAAFVTLTYDEENNPRHRGLSIDQAYKDVQLWFKTLRNRRQETLTYYDGSRYHQELPSRFRYFVAGEFGPNATHRLHWHCVLFGMPSFPKGKATGTCWQRGFLTWESVTVSRLAYAACYSVKKSEQHANYFQPSRRPALGTAFWTKRGIQAFHRGKLPQDIRSLKTGSSHWPLDSTARDKLNAGWIMAAESARDQIALDKFCHREREWQQRLWVDASAYGALRLANEEAQPG